MDIRLSLVPANPKFTYADTGEISFPCPNCSTQYHISLPPMEHGMLIEVARNYKENYYSPGI